MLSARTVRSYLPRAFCYSRSFLKRQVLSPAPSELQTRFGGFFAALNTFAARKAGAPFARIPGIVCYTRTHGRDTRQIHGQHFSGGAARVIVLLVVVRCRPVQPGVVLGGGEAHRRASVRRVLRSQCTVAGRAGGKHLGAFAGARSQGVRRLFLLLWQLGLAAHLCRYPCEPCVAGGRRHTGGFVPERRSRAGRRHRHVPGNHERARASCGGVAAEHRRNSAGHVFASDGFDGVRRFAAAVLSAVLRFKP